MSQDTVSSTPQLEPNHPVNMLFTVLTGMAPNQLMSLYGDLLTEREAIMLAKRLVIARYLLHGYSYQQIQAQLAVTPATISQIKKVLISSGQGLREADSFLNFISAESTTAGDTGKAQGFTGKLRAWWSIQ